MGIQSIHTVQVIEKLGDGLVGCMTECGEQLWARVEGKPRKFHRCIVCGQPIPKTANAMYSPISNQRNRMVRACSPCIEK